MDQELLQIKEIDDAVLYHEFIALMGERIFEPVPDITLNHDFSLKDFSSVESEFLSLFKQLTVTKTGKSYVGVSCIFNAPCRQAVYAEDYYMANDINKAILGKGLSKQSFMIVPKIKEIDVFLHRNPEFQNKLIEAHPEVCFAMLNRDEKYIMPMPIFENKKTEAGTQSRVELLSRFYERTNQIMAYVHQDPKLKRMVDDVMDALCLAVTGMLVEKVGLKSIPKAPMKDKRNLLMQMVYVEKC